MHYAFAGRPNEVIVDHSVGRSYRGSHDDPLLSLKCMFNGQTHYRVDGGRSFALDDTSYVVLNRAHAYRFEKRSPTPVETFCIFFPAGLSLSVAQDLTSRTEHLLDRDMEAPRGGDFRFLEHRRPHGDAISAHVLRMRQQLVMLPDDAWLEEQLLVLLAKLLHGDASVRRSIARLPRARASLRMELFRRVHRARDFMHAHLHQSVPLERAARAAAMSPYHFLRSFQQLFGVTPRAYLATERLRHARELLERTHLSVTQVCAAAGFQSLPSFVNAFRSDFGLPPARYRAHVRAQSSKRR